MEQKEKWAKLVGGTLLPIITKLFLIFMASMSVSISSFLSIRNAMRFVTIRSIEMLKVTKRPKLLFSGVLTRKKKLIFLCRKDLKRGERRTEPETLEEKKKKDDDEVLFSALSKKKWASEWTVWNFKSKARFSLSGTNKRRFRFFNYFFTFLLLSPLKMGKKLTAIIKRKIVIFSLLKSFVSWHWISLEQWRFTYNVICEVLKLSTTFPLEKCVAR